MKHYTEKVRRGLLTIETSMQMYAEDKRDEGDRENDEQITAALAWINDQQRKAEIRKNRARPNADVTGLAPAREDTK